MTNLVSTLTSAFAVMDLGIIDQPTKELALEYAKRIDESTDKRILRSLGPELLRVLVELKMTPKSRQEIDNNMKGAMSDADVVFINSRSNARNRYTKAPSYLD